MMNRREFIVASGSTTVLGLSAPHLQQPAFGLEFELSVEDVNSDTVSSVLVDFTRFEIVPRYVDESDNLTISIEVIVGSRSASVSETLEISNGDIIDSADLSSVIPLVVDGLNLSSGVTNGEVSITLEHSDIGVETYNQAFDIAPSNLTTDYSIPTPSDPVKSGDTINFNSFDIEYSGLDTSTDINLVYSLTGTSEEVTTSYGISDSSGMLTTTSESITVPNVSTEQPDENLKIEINYDSLSTVLESGSFTIKPSSESISWSTGADWDNAVNEMYVGHSSGTVRMTEGVDGFEDLSNGDSVPSAWNPDQGSITNSYSYEGSNSIYTSSDGDGSVYNRSINNRKPSEVTYAYRETSNSSGHRYELEGSNGLIVNVGTGNDGTGFNASYSGCFGNPGYNTFFRFRIVFDWSSETMDIYHENPDGTVRSSSTDVGFANTGSGITQVKVGKEGSNARFCGENTRGINDTWQDEMYGVLNNSYIETADKSFSSSGKPDINSASYNLNGQDIDLTVIGSPGSTSEETQTITLDGSSSYSLSWNSQHKKFRIRLEMSSTDRVTSPSFSAVELKIN